MRKSARIFVIICVCAALIACAAAPAYASSTAEYHSYTDYFDTDSASVHVSAYCELRLIDSSAGIVVRYVPNSIVSNNNSLVMVSRSDIATFLGKVDEYVETNNVDLSDMWIGTFFKIDSLYSSHASGSGFPFAAYKFNLTAVGTNLELTTILDSIGTQDIPKYWSNGSVSYTLTYPSPFSASVSGSAEWTPEHTWYYTKSVDLYGAENLWFENSCTVSMESGVNQRGDAQYLYDKFQALPVGDLVVCGLSFSIYNVYQYLMPPETSAPPPWNEVSEPVITSPTVPPEDEFYKDKTKDLGAKVDQIFNGVPFAKYSQAAIALSKYFKKLFSDIPFIGDLMNVFVAFAAFNILLGGFVVGVRAFATDDRSRQRQQDNIKARQEAARQRRVDEFMRDDPPSPEEWYNK